MAASPYFGGKSVAPKGVPLPPILNPKGDTRFTKQIPKPRTVQVRAHTRTIQPPKPRPVQAKNTQQITPAVKHGATQRFYKPLFPGQKPDGYETVRSRPPGRAGIGSKVTARPFYLARRGPTGDSASQLSSKQLVTARRAGVQKSVGMNVIDATVHPLTDLSQQALGAKPFSLGGAVSDVANIGSNFVPVGKAAGILGGLRGLKKLNDAKVAVDAAKVGAHTTPEAAELRAAVKGARSVRGRQEAGYSVERSARAAKANAIYRDKTLSVGEREAKADAVLRGELPKINYHGFQDFTPGVLDSMKAQVMEHPTLQSLTQKKLLVALNKAQQGTVPTHGELNLIETTFGKDTRVSIAKIASNPSKYKDLAFEVGNIPRSLMASVDVSGVLRQGIGAATNHPIISARNFKGMMSALKNEEFYQQGMKEIATRPNAPSYHMGGLAVTDLEDINAREEAFASNLAEKITGLGKRERSPVRWSGRAYTYFLSKTRADIFDHYITQFAEDGRNVHDPEFLKGLSDMINSFTGRGYTLGGLSHGTSGKVLNTLLFSPKLMASRFDLLNPVYYAKMPKGLRLLALRHSLVTVGLIMSTLELARLGGLKVGLDPRSADFAKIKVGNTRIDVAAGYQQVIRALAQIATQESVSSSTGQVSHLNSGKFGQKTGSDVMTGFFEGKESPLASMASDWVLRGGRNTVGQKMGLRSEAFQHLSPLLLQDARDIYNQKHGGINGLAWALGGYGLGALGVGIQTYATPQPKSRGGQGGYFGSSSGGGSSPYFGSTGGNSSSPYFGGP